jgi:hypothetical protein
MRATQSLAMTVARMAVSYKTDVISGPFCDNAGR